MSEQTILLGDIGGTNARFTLERDGALDAIVTTRVADHRSLADALAEFLEKLPKEQRPQAAGLACAGPRDNGVIALTNSSWRADSEELKRRFGFDRVVLANDFAAVAWALPRLRPENLEAVGKGTAKHDRPSAVVGPGTGLGFAGYLPSPVPQVIESEGGHATLPATSEAEAEVIARVRADLGHVSAETLVSGQGLVRLYETLAAIGGSSVPPRRAPAITEAALSNDCAISRAALDMFCALLGSVAGNLALTFGAQGGVYIAGGIVPRIATYLTSSEFRGRFESKGRFRDYLADIPTWIIQHPEPAFLGLSHLLEQRSPSPSDLRSSC